MTQTFESYPLSIVAVGNCRAYCSPCHVLYSVLMVTVRVAVIKYYQLSGVSAYLFPLFTITIISHFNEDYNIFLQKYYTKMIYFV